MSFCRVVTRRFSSNVKDEILRFAQDDTGGEVSGEQERIADEKYGLERIGALAELNGCPFHFGHFFDRPATASAASIAARMCSAWAMKMGGTDAGSLD
jgi:hypothetical protein